MPGPQEEWGQVRSLFNSKELNSLNLIYEFPFARQGLSCEISSVKLVTCPVWCDFNYGKRGRPLLQAGGIGPHVPRHLLQVRVTGGGLERYTG